MSIIFIPDFSETVCWVLTEFDLSKTLSALFQLIGSYREVAVEKIMQHMQTVEPFAFTCHKKKLYFFIILETSLVCAMLEQARRDKEAEEVYFFAKLIAVCLHVTTLNAVVQFFAWVLIFGLFVFDAVIVTLAIVCLAWGNLKGRRIWMRVSPKRKMYEMAALIVYHSMKLLMLLGWMCTYTTEGNRWYERSPRSRILIPFFGMSLREEKLYETHAKQYPLVPYSLLNLRIKTLQFLKTSPNYRDIVKTAYHRGKGKTHTHDNIWWLPKLPRRSKGMQGSVWPDFGYAKTLVELDTVSNLRYGILFILALSSLTVYSIILAGWSSNSKYAFLGALRSAAQMISYEVSISLALLPVILLSGSLNLTQIVFSQAATIWYIFPLLPVALVFLVSMLAETNRTPFDLPEAEAELVAGYNVDYSSLPFAMFFLGEYANMILISVLFCILFLGGWELFGFQQFAPLVLALKAAVPWVFFVLVRATLPRYRYDQLMDIGWKAFLPLTGAFLVLVIGFVVFLDVAPVVEELPL